jgi:hypothetical protein
MSGNPLKNRFGQVRQAVLLLLGVALAVRIAWYLLIPVVPTLVSIAVVFTVLGVALFGRKPPG